MKIMRILSVLFVLLLTSSPSHAGLLEFFFPMLKEQKADPGETLQAPFKTPTSNAQNEEGKPEELPTDSENLALPHRSDAEISLWITQVISDALSFEKGTYEENQDHHRQYFVTQGWNRYIAFMQKMNMPNIVDSRQYRIISFVDGNPLLINRAEVNGSYKWAYEVPVMITYMKSSDPADYTKIIASPQTQRLNITVQIGRQPLSEDTEGLRVEEWIAKPRK